MKAAIYTLGCKVNQYEAQEMISILTSEGISIVDSKDDADIYIINSCTVTAESSRKTRQAVRKFRSLHTESIIVLTGCYPQAFPDEVRQLSEVDIFMGNNTNINLISNIREFTATGNKVDNIIMHKRDDTYKGTPIDNFEGHTRAFVKIQDGCNRYCSYCTIPKARGFSRSRDIEDIRREVMLLSKQGYKEIVFVGINLSAYGLDNGSCLTDALMTAEETEGIERIRLGSLEPDHITDEIIEKLSQMKKFCPQFHLSLQSGCDRILRKMNRHYTAEEYYTLCRKLKDTFDDISLTTDIIVGFPSESDEDFAQTVDFAKKCGFMKVHVFPFSPREGTPAWGYKEKIQNNVKNHRCAVLQKECDDIRREFMNEYIGKTVKVLFETPKGKIQQGYTENYTPVNAVYNEDLCGKIVSVKITEVCDNGCSGEITE